MVTPPYLNRGFSSLGLFFHILWVVTREENMKISRGHIARRNLRRGTGIFIESIAEA
jgi:hypothetical protein